MDDEYAGLPPDFDINANIQTLTYDLKRVPLAMYFYNLVKRMELEKAKREGRTFKTCILVMIMMLCVGFLIRRLL